MLLIVRLDSSISSQEQHDNLIEHGADHLDISMNISLSAKTNIMV
jgi:hypothetical protein